MKKYLSIILAAILMAGCLSACNSGNKETDRGNGKIQIVTTIFPEYDWVMNVLGENPAGAEVTMLLDNGVDLHSYQPTADDILKISACDLFIYVGGESDEWVDDALQESTNDGMIIINLLDVLGGSVKEEEIVEGMQEDEHDHDDADTDEHEDEEIEHDEYEGEEIEHDEHEDEEIEYDEHVWLSLKNASVLVRKISDAIQAIDQEHTDTYKTNTSAYLEKINALDAEYKAAVDRADFHTLLFGDRFPFRYLVDDYGLDYYAAFVGCSAETEASFETITFLAQKVDELGLPAVMTIEKSDHRIAETIIQNTKDKNKQILTMDSMQGSTSSDVQNGTTYLSVMENNLSVLTDALNKERP